jgi:uncharacterized protein (TIGR03118 family)
MTLYRAIPKTFMSLPTVIVGALTLSACGGGSTQAGGSTAPTGPTGSGLADTALVSNKVGVVGTQTTIDANLSNPWGLATGPGLPFWVADNNSNVATLYSGTGQIQTHTATGATDTGIAIPPQAPNVPARVTGEVFTGNSGGFVIPTQSGPQSAQFVFDSESGTLAAWASGSGAGAVTMYDDSSVNGSEHAVYKGLASGTLNGQTFLYATDLHNGKVDVFDSNFMKPIAMQGRFVDPTLPAGFAPFGIAAINDQLYVTYAKQDGPKNDETFGAGMGYIDAFDFGGNFAFRFASAGVLNAPWGIAAAPTGFGSIAGDLLVGNFGDGSINVFSPNGTQPATSMAPLSVANGGTFSVPGLWALQFGNGDTDKPLTTLFYTAGFANQTDGVFGSVAVSTTPPAATPPPNPYQP